MGVGVLDVVVVCVVVVVFQDVSDILFIFGIIGCSKGVLCVYWQLLLVLVFWVVNGKIISDDCYLCINLFFYNFGYKVGILVCLQIGVMLILYVMFDLLYVLWVIECYCIIVLLGFLIIYQSLLDYLVCKDFDLSLLWFVVIGVVIVLVVLVECMQFEFDIDIVLIVYGLIEVNGMGMMCCFEDDVVIVVMMCGWLFVDFELCIVDDGEVLLCGLNVMVGYLDDMEVIVVVIDVDGWLYIGDIGVVDQVGNLCIIDCLKDMYICGGFNVYFVEVEQVLVWMDGVVDVVVIGVFDQWLGEVGWVFVVVCFGMGFDEVLVIVYICEYLVNFKIFWLVWFVDVLLCNVVGKVSKL